MRLGKLRCLEYAVLGSGVYPSSRMGITCISKGNGGESALLHKRMYYNEGVLFEAFIILSYIRLRK